MGWLFNFDDVKQMVRLTGELLKREDQLICEYFRRNTAYASSVQVPGILNLNVQDERYYQRLTWRALLPSFGYVARLEWSGFDIALFRDGENSPAAIGQMKRWLGSGFQGVSESKEDKEKLVSCPHQSCAHFLLAFTAAGFTTLGESYLDTFVRDALDQIECSKEKRWLYRFSTVLDNDGHGPLTDGQFGVLGVLLKEGSPGQT
jgi:hypothetical protein